jgi:predicted outer membrane protein
MKIRLSFLPLAAAICLCPMVVLAQNPSIRTGQPGEQQQPGQADQSRPGAPQLGERGQSSGASSTDAELAACLLVDNQNEIALSQLATQRAQSEDVKRFAQQMIQEHQQLGQTLEQFAGRGSQTSQATQQSNPSQNAALPRDAGQIAQRPSQGTLAQADRPGQGANITSFKLDTSRDGGLNLVSLKQELGAQCLQSARQELDQKQGSEFDMCFMGMQIAGHMKVIDELKVAQNHASPEFRSKLSDAQKTAEGHLDHAKQIAKSQMAQAQAGHSAPGSRQ